MPDTVTLPRALAEDMLQLLLNGRFDVPAGKVLQIVNACAGAISAGPALAAQSQDADRNKGAAQ